ncbi:hypothetical protein Tco_1295896, partial [Tanacetum coccineum]
MAWIYASLLQFSRIFALDDSQAISVADRLRIGRVASFLRREPRGGVETEQLEAISALIQAFVISPQHDKGFLDAGGRGINPNKKENIRVNSTMIKVQSEPGVERDQFVLMEVSGDDVMRLMYSIRNIPRLILRPPIRLAMI